MKKICTLIALAAMILISSLPIVEAQKKPSPEIPLRVRIENTSDYRIISDGRGDYVHGEQGVSATLGNGGEGDFLMDPTNSQSSSPRALWFDFSQKIADGTLANPWDWQLVQIDTYLNFNGINTVAVNSAPEAPPELRTGGFGQLYSSTSNKSYFNLKFLPTDPSKPNPNYPFINSPNETSNLEVRHPDCNTWIITPKTVPYIDSGYGSGSGAVAGLINIPLTRGGTTRSVGQYLMPFKITLTRKTLIACP